MSWWHRWWRANRLRDWWRRWRGKPPTCPMPPRRVFE